MTRDQSFATWCGRSHPSPWDSQPEVRDVPIAELTKINRKQVVGYASFQLTTTGSGVTATSLLKRRSHIPSMRLFWLQERSTSKAKLEKRGRPGNFINKDGSGIAWSGSAQPQSFCQCSWVVWGLWGASGLFPNPRHWYFSHGTIWNRTGSQTYSLFLGLQFLFCLWDSFPVMGWMFPPNFTCWSLSTSEWNVVWK